MPVARVSSHAKPLGGLALRISIFFSCTLVYFYWVTFILYLYFIPSGVHIPFIRLIPTNNAYPAWQPDSLLIRFSPAVYKFVEARHPMT